MESNIEMDTSSSSSGSASPLRRARDGRGGGRGGGRVGRGRGTRGRGARGGRRGSQETQQQLLVENENQRKEKVKAIVKNMTEEGAKDILCQVIDKQPGIIFDVLDRITPGPGDGGYHPRPGSRSPSWCICGHCREMPTLLERQCCALQPGNCVSNLQDMAKYALDEGVLAIARLYRREVLVYPEEGEVTRANRHQAYRQFTLWRHGRLGAGVRRVVPSCCVWRIRDKFPDPFGAYTGYKPSRLGRIV